MASKSKSGSNVFPISVQTENEETKSAEFCAQSEKQCFAFCNRFERICDHIDSEGLEWFSRICYPKSFWQRRMLYRKGAPVNEIYFIESGLVSFAYLFPDGRRQILDFLGPGDVIGLPVLWGETTISVQALNQVHVNAIRTQDFIEFLNAYPIAAMRLFMIAPRKVNSLHRHIVTLGRKRADERMGEFLLMIRKKLGVANSKTVHLPMSRMDIADYLGLTIETVSRALAELKSAGLIEIPRRGEVVFLDIPGLVQFSSVEETV